MAGECQVWNSYGYCFFLEAVVTLYIVACYMYLCSTDSNAHVTNFNASTESNYKAMLVMVFYVWSCSVLLVS
jgi:hypothetical protein